MGYRKWGEDQPRVTSVDLIWGRNQGGVVDVAMATGGTVKGEWLSGGGGGGEEGKRGRGPW